MFQFSYEVARLMRKWMSLFAVALGVVALTSCASSQSSSDQPTTSVRTVVQTSVVQKTVSVTVPAPTTPAATTDGGSDSFKMPNEVGKGLQDAQDDVQRVSGNPLFYTGSTDATGAGRMQILDRDWKVCSQNVASGTTVNEDTNISFAAAKLDENCP